jgi:hypothetical protein
MQGTLQDFGLAEILQLVAMQHKTGLLRVEDGDKVLTFYFENGTLISCRDRRRIAEDPLLDYLRNTGWLDAWQVLHLKLEVEENRRDLADVLLEKNLLTADEIRTVLEDLAQDLVYRTYNWKQGSYRFISGDEALRGVQHRVALNMEGLLLESARRVDEWPGLFKRLPGAGVMLDGVETLPSWLEPRSHAVLSRLKSPMRLGELVACARVPEFEVYEVVAAALEAGLTRILEMPAGPTQSPAAPTPVAAPAFQRKPRVLSAPARTWAGDRVTLLAAAALVFCALAAGLLLTRTVRETFRSAPAAPEARARLVRDLEIHRALTGRYPQSLEALSSTRIAGPDLASQAGVAVYAAQTRGRSYRLEFTSSGGISPPSP